VLFDWIGGVPVEVIEQHYSTTPFKGKISSGDVRRFADNARWCLRSVYEIVAIIYPANCPVPSEIDMLCHSLEIGVPADAVGLLALPLRLTRGDYLALRRAGLFTREQVRSSHREALVQIIGESNVDKLIPSSRTQR
jgi:helicase